MPSDIVLLEKHNEPADFFMDSQDHTQDSDSLTVPEVTPLPSYNGDDGKHKHDETPIPSSQSNGGSEDISGSSGFFDSVSSQAIATAPSKMSFKSSAATVGKTNNTTRILKPKSVLGSPLKGKGRNEPQLLLNYISLGSKTYVFPLLLDEYGNTNYAYKPNFVYNILVSETPEWVSRPTHVAFPTATIVKRRKSPYGLDEAVIGWKEYPVDFLSMHILCNAAFENVERSVRALGEMFLAFLKEPEFSSYYLGEMQCAFGTEGKLYNQLTNPKHKLYSIMDKAKVVLHKMESLDEFLMDREIAALIPVSVRNQNPDSWPDSAIKKLYKSGTLPPSFLSLL